jgi:hypothetical protein
VICSPVAMLGGGMYEGEFGTPLCIWYQLELSMGVLFWNLQFN